MTRLIDPVVLEGRHVMLEPMDLSHEAELRAAAADGELWKLWYTSVPAPDATRGWIETALAQRDNLGAMPFVVRRLQNGMPGPVVGSTRMFNVDETHRRLEIGHTWYARSAQRTPVNTECKLLLLAHAFEQLRCIAVEFRTHWMNHQSRAAIARLGAKQDGVLRSHMVMPDGSLRDTVVFSIIACEWPTVKRHLHYRLEMPRQG